MASLDDPQNAYENDAWLAETRADIARRYASARRHSRVVRVLRYALPIISVLGVVAFIVIAYVLPQLPSDISASSIDVNSNSIVMQDPHVSGYLSGGRTYEVRADRAEQQLQDTKVVTLHNINATLGFGNGETAKINAKSGIFHADSQRIELNDTITISTTTGIKGSLESADIDMKAGTMRTDKPIEFSSEGSLIRANGVSVENKGQWIEFTGPVHVTYAVPDESKPDAAEPQR